MPSNHSQSRPFLLCLSIVVALGLCVGAAAQEDDSGSLAERLEEAKRKAVESTYLLQYKFEADETLRWKVVHLATTETKIQGNTQTSKSRSLSTKVWTVTDVDDEGQMTFTHMVADVDMWQHISDRPEVRYNSQTDQAPPPEYAQVAQTVGVPLAQVTIDKFGRVTDREKNPGLLDLGLGEIVLPLPGQPIRVGDSWYADDEVRVRMANERIKPVKTRQQFTLEKVKTGVATISVKTQVITPVNDPKIEAQLIQQMVHGTVRFDIDAGRILSREINWDETVVGFSGAGSMMKYLARFNEDLLTEEPRTARKQ